MSPPEIRDAAQRAAARAGERWPAAALPAGVFDSFLQQRAATEQVLDAHGEELFLACAVLAGDPAAQQAFELEFMARVPVFVARFAAASDFCTEVQQQLRERLLVGVSPRLAAYAGTGPLIEWLKVAAIRLAINMTRSAGRLRLHADAESAWADALASDAEIEALRNLHRGQFQLAIEAAVQSLSPRERTLLRLHFLDGISAGQIGTMYGVHKATAARWLVQLRQQVFAHVAASLAEHGAQPGDLRSLYRLLKSDMRLSLSRLLGSTLPGEASTGPSR